MDTASLAISMMSNCLETYFTPFLWTQGWFVYKAMEKREWKGTNINTYVSQWIGMNFKKKCCCKQDKYIKYI